MVVTGVRWAESLNRRNTHGVANVQGKPKTTRKLADDMGAEYKLNKHGEVIMNDDNDANRRMVEQCYRTQKTMVNPIVDWTDEDVWGFLNENGIPHCSLYDEGHKRLGCIGCPLAGTREMLRDFERYPKYKENYIRAFQRMIDNHPGQIRILDPEAETKFKLDVEAVGPENIGGGYTEQSILPECGRGDGMVSARMEPISASCSSSPTATDNFVWGGVRSERPCSGGGSRPITAEEVYCYWQWECHNGHWSSNIEVTKWE